MLNLTTPIEKLSRVGPKNSPRLKKLGIKTVKNLLWHFPHRYDDYTKTVKISDIKEVGEIISITGQVEEIKTVNIWRRRMSVTEAHITDDSNKAIRAVWFNQPYIENSLPAGSLVSFSGKISLDKKGLYFSAPSYERIAQPETRNYKLATDLVHTGRLVPVYPETSGISSKYLRFLIKSLLPLTKNATDPLPQAILDKYNLPSLNQSLTKIHFPDSLEQAERAKKRISFEELLLFQLKSIISRRNTLRLKATPVAFEKELIKNFVASLPFTLTNDQRIATFEILKDLGKKYPMNRLLNGDVGSGKTVVALIAAYQTANQKLQTVFMAPTEILARQHFATLKSLLQRAPLQGLAKVPFVRVGLLTGSEAKQWPTDEITNEDISKKLLQQKIAEGEIDIVIGTHAVIQKNVSFKNLGLVVVDEQHRFGVEQRMKLVKSPKITPHLLSMTATPIPRTLALTIYGDLDISLIKEKPKGRQEVITHAIPHSKRGDAYKFIEKEVRNGRQVFVICPRIEISNPKETIKAASGQNKMNILWADVKAVTAEYEKLKKEIFPRLNVAMLHGKLKPKEKQGIMSGFEKGLYDILVSTSVIEVGVDIPNATIMMIESADRFGLAQLHQFRGRVGRDKHQSYCLLFASGEKESTQRLKALEKTNDGFALAEADLKLRGPGEFTGVKQSGIPDLAMASLTDLDLIKKARLEAKLLLKGDPNLQKCPLLKERLNQFQKIRHFE